MRRRSIEPTVATYGTLITIASDAQQSGRVKEAWGWLHASGLEVHVTCVNAYLDALIKEVRSCVDLGLVQWAKYVNDNLGV